MTSPTALAQPLQPPRVRSQIRTVTKRLLRQEPLGCFAVGAVCVMAALALLAPVLRLQGPNEISAFPLAYPGSGHWFGTDNLGRDVLSRTIWGARVSLYVAVIVSGLSSLISLVLGLWAGYAGGVADFIVQRGVDFFMAVPWIILVMALVLVLGGSSLLNVALTLSVLYGVRNARVVRAVVQTIRSAAYVEAGRAIGAGPARILLRHITPNTLGPVVVLLSTVWGTAIIAEATLSFLGLGTPATTPSWGQMIAQARPWMESQPFYVVGPGVFLGVTVWALNMAGDFIRDIADPRLRGE